MVEVFINNVLNTHIVGKFYLDTEHCILLLHMFWLLSDISHVHMVSGVQMLGVE